MATKPPKCIQCKKVIKNGRADKRFCDIGCKDDYYNAIKIAEHKEIKKIDTILKRNRRVLKKLYDPKKKDKIFTRETLIKAGIEFGFHTHAAITKNQSNEITFCYDYGYREISTSKFHVFYSFDKVQVKDGDIFEVWTVRR